jgi:hypothetical protein
LVLARVVEYMTHHVNNPPKEIEKPLRSENMADVVSQWDANFVNVVRSASSYKHLQTIQTINTYKP